MIESYTTTSADAQLLAGTVGFLRHPTRTPDECLAVVKDELARRRRTHEPLGSLPALEAELNFHIRRRRPRRPLRVTKEAIWMQEYGMIPR